MVITRTVVPAQPPPPCTHARIINVSVGVFMKNASGTLIQVENQTYLFHPRELYPLLVSPDQKGRVSAILYA